MLKLQGAWNTTQYKQSSSYGVVHFSFLENKDKVVMSSVDITFQNFPNQVSVQYHNLPADISDRKCITIGNQHFSLTLYQDNATNIYTGIYATPTDFGEIVVTNPDKSSIVKVKNNMVGLKSLKKHRLKVDLCLYLQQEEEYERLLTYVFKLRNESSLQDGEENDKENRYNKQNKKEKLEEAEKLLDALYQNLLQTQE